MRYYLQVNNLDRARGSDADLAFQGATPETFASTLGSALRQSSLFERWKAKQPDPDAVDDSLGQADPQAQVRAKTANSSTEVEVDTSLPHAILKHRLRLLIGPNWTLRDVQ